MLNRYCTAPTTAADALEHVRQCWPQENPELITAVTTLVQAMFCGHHPDFQKADLRYHDFQHTLLASQCYIDLARGRARLASLPVFTARDFMLGYAAIMLHDTGYLKRREDSVGTGAKYTAAHVVRSCELASQLLPAFGCAAEEIEGVCNAIRCTGLTSRIDQLVFRDDVQRLTGCMVATADYLGQMADPDYPEKLSALFDEFEEDNIARGVPPEKRLFASARELMAKTGGFWQFFVLPKLQREYENVYLALAQSDGQNPYVAAVELNLTRIAARAVAG